MGNFHRILDQVLKEEFLNPKFFGDIDIGHTKFLSDVGDNFQNWANVHAILAIVNPRPDQQNYNRILICELIQRLEICCDSVVTKKNFSNHNRITTEF